MDPTAVETPKAQFTPDMPEVQALAGMSGIDPAQLAAAFSEPEQFFTHMTLDQLARLKVTCDRFAEVQTRMFAALDIYTAYAHGVLAGSASQPPEVS